jgi:uncharacterized protein (DUF433 family)
MAEVTAAPPRLSTPSRKRSPAPGSGRRNDGLVERDVDGQFHPRIEDEIIMDPEIEPFVYVVSASPLEAEYVTSLSRKLVDQAIDRREVEAIPSPAARLVGYAELVYLRLRREIGEMLSNAGRRLLYTELRRVLPHNPKLEKVELGIMNVVVIGAVSTVRQRLAQVRQSERYVSIRPDVRAGEPVVRGTRVPVHVLADLARQGAGRDELLADYPAVTPPALDAALLYARLHPRRGPRRAAPWHAAGV